jgi:protein gp37
MNNVKNSIKWADYTINPVKGLCPQACPYCYARRLYKWLRWDETIRYDDSVWQTGSPIPRGSRVFVGSTMELFGDWIQPEWMEAIFEHVKALPEVNFLFLTKKPENLIKWSSFPDNAWVGVSYTGKERFGYAYSFIGLQAKVKYISFEPVLAHCLENVNSFSQSMQNANINWIIIGQQTPVNPKTAPQLSWIQEIVEAADRARIPVFLKDNLYKLCASQSTPWAWQKYDAGRLRQELP